MSLEVFWVWTDAAVEYCNPTKRLGEGLGICFWNSGRVGQVFRFSGRVRLLEFVPMLVSSCRRSVRSQYFDHHFFNFHNIELFFLFFFLKDAPWNSLQNHRVRCFPYQIQWIFTIWEINIYKNLCFLSRKMVIVKFVIEMVSLVLKMVQTN